MKPAVELPGMIDRVIHNPEALSKLISKWDMHKDDTQKAAKHDNVVFRHLFVAVKVVSIYYLFKA